MTWDDYFIEMTKLVASKSKDDSVKVGCVIVGPDNEIRSTGFNGFPRGVQEYKKPQVHVAIEKEYQIASRDTLYKCLCGKVLAQTNEQEIDGEFPEHFRSTPDSVTMLNERWQRPAKYSWVEHAERNAVYNAARTGIPLKGCTAYVSMFPCKDCTRALVQSGIDIVVSPPPPEITNTDWGFDISVIMMAESGLIHRGMEWESNEENDT